MKILDCTLRDGGYYTNWDFERKLVDLYIKEMNSLPIDYLEVGYRSNPLKGYHGEYFYLPLYRLEQLKSLTKKKLVVILNEKDIIEEHVNDLLTPCLGLVDMVRLAIDPTNFGRAIKLANAVKVMGFEVGFNVMYMSKWKEQDSFLNLLPEVKDIANYFYMVDSFGGIYPSDVKEIIHLVKTYIPDVPLGFHAHNNLELALINTLTALDEGCEIVDATITGMGRGAGNLKTELLLTSLNSHNRLDVDFNPLSKIVGGFVDLQKKYEWGANLPYMVSGAYSLPQKDVMDWVSKRYYSFNSIIRALQNKASGIQDNMKLDKLELKNCKTKVILVGGGPSVNQHFQSIFNYLHKNQDVILVHASSKHAQLFKNLKNKQIFCLVGNEGHRLEDAFSSDYIQGTICVLPPFPRTMGTYIPNNFKEISYELTSYDYTNIKIDSHTSIALQVLKELKPDEVYLIGYDGYKNETINQKEQELLEENSILIKDFVVFTGIKLISLFDTVYKIPKQSIYSLL